MYTDLGTLFSELKKAASLVLTPGDFNAKVGSVPEVKYALEDTQEGRETTLVKYLLIFAIFITYLSVTVPFNIPHAILLLGSSRGKLTRKLFTSTIRLITSYVQGIENTS